MKFSGFLVVYEESLDEDKKSEEPENVRIPAGLVEGPAARDIIRRLWDELAALPR